MKTVAEISSTKSLAELDDSDLVDTIDAMRILGGPRSPISRATLDRGVKSGRFPAPIQTCGINRFRVGRLRACLRAAEQATAEG